MNGKQTLIAVCVCCCWSFAVHGEEESRTRTVSESAVFGRALSWDWDFREGEEPPMKETIDINYDRENKETLKFRFKAFDKEWKILVRRNEMLLSDKLTFEFRTTTGEILRSNRGPRDCYYIGTAEASRHEAGLVAITTCTGVVRALIITNLNDYVIIPTSGSLTKRRQQRDAETKYDIQVADLTDFDNYLKEKGFGSSSGNSTRRFRRDQYADIVLAPIPPPTGRSVYVEVGAIFDQYYLDDFKTMMSNDINNLFIHAAEIFNNAQLWFIHPTFGFQVWFTLRNVIFIEDDVTKDLEGQEVKSYPASICKWQAANFSDSSNWDEVFMFSSKEGIWHGRVGMAQRSGVCEEDGVDKCAGVTHMNFQMATLARLTAHEGSHPLGMTDDYEGMTSKLCFTGLMRRGVWQDHDWSKCSVQHFQRWLEVSSTSCIQRRHTPSLGNSIRPPLLPVNIAWRAAAEQSSTYESDARWGAWKATDGEIAAVSNDDPLTGSCTHTTAERDPWVRVDLGDEYAYNFISYIYIYNRADCCSDRLHDFEVRVGYSTDIRRNYHCNFHKGAVPGGRFGMAVIRCKRALRGRYVSVQIKGEKEVLTVCEVQVFQSIYLDDFHDLSDGACVDHHGFCSFWAGLGECEKVRQQPFMHRKCPHSCGLCSRPGVPTASSRILSPSVKPTANPDPDCVDEHPSCTHVFANQECNTRRLYRTMCRKTCGFCGKVKRKPIYSRVDKERIKKLTKAFTEKNERKNKIENDESRNKSAEAKPCRDRTRGCYIRVRQGHCKWHSETREHCAESCGLCGIRKVSLPHRNKHKNCFDIHGSCTEWFRAGYCSWSESVKDFCPRTCNVCAQQKARHGRRAPRRKEDSRYEYVCKDHHFKCRGWAREGFCAFNVYTRHRCLKSCGVCK